MAEGVDGVKLWGVNEVKEDYSLFSLEFSLSRGTQKKSCFNLQSKSIVEVSEAEQRNDF